MRLHQASVATSHAHCCGRALHMLQAVHGILTKQICKQSNVPQTLHCFSNVETASDSLNLALWLRHDLLAIHVTRHKQGMQTP